MTIKIIYPQGEILLKLDKLFLVSAIKYGERKKIRSKSTIGVIKKILPMMNEENLKEIKDYLKGNCIEWLEDFETLVVRHQLKNAKLKGLLKQ